MRQTVRFAISAFATAAFALGALAQTPPPATRIVPVVGSTAGAHGAQFRTELQLQNPSDAAIGGTIVFRAAAVPGSPADPQLRYELAPFATVAFEDVVADLGASGLGSLDIVSDDERLPIIVVRAYNTRADGGTLGSSIFALAPEDALGADEPASLIVPADLVRYRLNIGIRTLVDAVALRGSVFAADGSPRGTFTRSFPANFFIQQPADDFTGIALQPNDSIVVELTEGRAFVYGTNTDNRTNDPSIQIDRLLRGGVRAEDASVETDEDVAVTVALEAFARGNRSYTFAVATAPAHGTLSVISQDGSGAASAVYTPDPDFNGADSFVYQVTDDRRKSDEATVEITVHPVNDAPAADAITATTPEDVGIAITLTGSDVDGDSLTFSVESGPSNGTLGVITAVSATSAEVTYMPAADFNGSDSFIFRVSDGTASATATVAITVTPGNDGPIAAADAWSVFEDNTLTVPAPGVLSNDGDTEGDPLTAVLENAPASGTLTLNANGSFTYVPAADFNGTVTFSYRANDGIDSSDPATVTITVGAVNDAPAFTAGTDVTITEDAGPQTIANWATAISAGPADEAGQALTFGVVSNSNPALFSAAPAIAANGTLTFTSAPDANGSATIEIRLVDDGGTANGGADTSATQSFTIVVTPVNDVPVATDDAVATDEDTMLTVPAPGVLGNDSDVEGDPLNAAVVTAPSNGTLTLNADGSFTYTPGADFNGTDAFTYIASDGTAASSSATVTITVNAVNDAPVATDDSFTTNEDLVLTVAAPGVLGNDADVDGNALTAVVVTGPSNGNVTLNADGSFVYTPNANFNGTDSFTYRANDGTVGSNIATVTVAVNAVNDAPAFTKGADQTVPEDSGAQTVLGWATAISAGPADEAGQALTFVIHANSNPALFDAAPAITAGGALTYTPAADANGTATITFALHDDGGTANGGVDMSPLESFTITVTPVNDAPLAADDAYGVDEDNTLTVPAPGVLANDGDADADSLTSVLVTGPGNGTLTLNANGSFTYAPNPNFNGLDSFTYRANDGSADSNTATVTITVNAVNDPPVAVDDAYSTNEDTALAVPAPGLLANDVDPEGSSLVGILLSTPANGNVILQADGSFTYTPNPDFNGTDSFTYAAKDGAASSNAATVTVTVNAVNDPPAIDLDADDDKGTGGSDFAATFTEGQPAALIVDAVDATIVDVDSPTLEGMTVTITNLLDAGNETLSVDTTGTSIVASYDGGTGVLTLTIGDSVANYEAVLRTVRYLNTSSSPDTTPRLINFVVNDGAANGNTAVSTVTVVSVDSDPVANADADTVVEDSGANAIDVLANDTDADGGPISITSVTQPANGSVAITGGGTGVTYTPNADYCNSPPGTTLKTFTYTLSPGGSTATVTVTVTCVDDAPTAVADSATVNEDSGANAIDVLANDTDADGGSISITSVTQPANGSVAITGGGTGITYTPNTNYCNTPPGTTLESFTYTLSPGGSSTTVTVTVTCVDDDPVAVADAATVVEDSGANAIDVLANDTDADGGTISIVSVTQPANGAVAITNGGADLTYTPNANYCNTPPGTTLESFTYTLTPGGSSTTVTVSVTCVDDPPTAVADAATVDEDSGANTINVQANDSDVDGGSNLIVAVTQPANGTVAITNGGADVTYTPNANYCNTPPGTTLESFTYTLTPGGSSTTVTVAVNCINDPPVAGTDTFETFGNTELRVDLAAGTTPHVPIDLTGASGVLNNDSDPVEGTAVSLTGVVGCADLTAPFDCATANGGQVIVEADGSFSYRPPQADPAYTSSTASDSFQYLITDAEGAGATGTVNLTLREVIWYVNPAAAPGGDGRSHAPFQSFAPLNGVGGSGDVDNADDYIVVHTGSMTSSIELEAGQRLVGEGVGLSLPLGALGTFQILAPGTHPEVSDGAGDAVKMTSAVPARVAGLSLAGGVNAIGMQATGAYSGSATLSIDNNVFRGAGAEGIDIDLGATGTLQLSIASNSWSSAGTHTGNAIDVRTTAGDVRLAIQNNTSVLGNGISSSGIVVSDDGAGIVTITGFSGNTVHQSTTGNGISVNGANFDAIPGGGADRVYGGTTSIGAAGDGVGGLGLVLTSVMGDLAFGDASTAGDLDVYSAGAALTATSSLLSGIPQFRLTVRPTESGGSCNLEATAGPAVDVSAVTADLRVNRIISANGLKGVSLVNLRPGSPAASYPAIFRAPAGSSISTSNAAATAFRVDQSNATITYGGTITSTAGTGILLTNNTGSTIDFTGTLTLSTGSSPAFSASGGGTVTSTGSASTLTTTTGTALNVASTVIGASGLTFRSISANGAPNGIVLSGTLSGGSDGGLTVAGTGSAASGGTIQNTTGVGVSLTNTANAALNYVQISNTGSHGLSGAGLVDESGGVQASLSIANSRFTSPGDGDNESAMFFGTTAVPGNNSGRISVTNTVVEQYEEYGLEAANDSGTLTIEVTGTLSGLTDSTTKFDDNNDTHGQGGILVVSKGTANVTLNVTGVFFNNVESEAIMAHSTAATSMLDVNLVNNVSINGGGPDNFPSGGGFAIVQDAGGSATYDIKGNTIRDLKGDGIVIIADGPSEGRIGGPGAGEGNVISGSLVGDGIRIDTDQLPGNGNNFTATILIQGNNIGGDATFPGIGDDGIQILNRDGTKTLNLTIENNQISNTTSEAVRYFTDADVSDGALRPQNSVRIVGNTFANIGVSDAAYFVTQETAQLCLHMASNSFAGANRNISLNQAGLSEFKITQASVAALAAANSGSTASSSGTITFNATCTNPPLPTNP